MDAFKAALAPYVGDVKVPNMGSRVFRECAFSFDTPESADGVYISLHSHSAFGKEFVSLDRERAALAGENIPAVYLRQKWRRVPKAAKAEDAAAPAADADAVTKLGLNVPGGYQVAGGDAGWEMDKSDVRLVVFTGAPHEDTHVSIAHPSETRVAGLDGKVLSAIEGIIAAADAEAAAAATSAAWEETREVSRFALELQQLNNGVRISPHAPDWRCGVPGCDKATSNLWLNLSDGFIGCGRDLGGGKGGNGHALAHFEATGRAFPLCVKLGTITPAGGDVYSYDPSEDDMVTDPHLASHLSHWGINAMELTKTEKSMAELTIEHNNNFEFSRICEGGKALVPASGVGLMGLDNLGNTCYMNAVLQLIATLPEARALYGAGLRAPDAVAERREALYRSAPALPQDDLLAQTAKLLHYMYSERYRLTEDWLARRREAGERERDAKAAGSTAAAGTAGSVPEDGKALGGAGSPPVPADPEPGAGGRCGFVTPRMFKSIIGKGHVEFSTTKQQDAAEFLEWMLGVLDRAHHAGHARLPPLPAGAGGATAAVSRLSDLFELASVSRVQDGASGGVRYAGSRDRFLRFSVPLEAATNKDEVAMAQATIDCAAAAADAAAVAEAETKAAAIAAVSGAAGGAAGSEGGEPASKRPRPEDAASDAAATATGNADAVAAKAAAGKGKPSKPATAGDKVRAEMSVNLPKLSVPFDACLAAYTAPSTIDDFKSPVTGEVTVATRTARLSSFPRYLWVVLSRYTLAADWTPKKIDASVPMPAALDLSALRGPEGLQEGEADLDALAAAAGNAPSPAAAAASAAAGGAGPQPDAAIVASLVSMGFPEGACKRAAVATGNASAEAASEWVMSHMDDPDFADPYVPAAPAQAQAPAQAAAQASDVPADVLEMVMSMGFDRDRATFALRQAGGNGDRAVDWLFSHMDEPLPAEPAAGAGGAAGGAGGPAAAAAAGPSAEDRAAAGRYELVGFLSHMGNSTGSGHYVAHVRKAADGELPAPGAAAGAAAGAGGWYFFNDNKVAHSEAPPTDLGYVYLYRRVA